MGEIGGNKRYLNPTISFRVGTILFMADITNLIFSSEWRRGGGKGGEGGMLL